MSVRIQTLLAACEWKIPLIVTVLVGSICLYPQALVVTSGTQVVAAVTPAVSKDVPSVAAWPLQVVPETDGAFRKKYGYLPPTNGPTYASLASMPADLRAYCLATAIVVANHYDVPVELILGIHYAEQMGHGWQCLQSNVSASGAVGPGQVTIGFWNGWYNADFSRFITEPQAICPCLVRGQQSPPGFGTDFDGDGLADPWTLADNIAATARHFVYEKMTNAAKNQANYASQIRDAMTIYANGTAYMDQRTPNIKRQYADIGTLWAMTNNNTAKVLAIANCKLDAEAANITCS
ncbi:hypothetical protein BH10CYA1_BH10CYA1_17970 [soil metagenome]